MPNFHSEISSSSFPVSPLSYVFAFFPLLSKRKCGAAQPPQKLMRRGVRALFRWRGH